MSQHQKNKNLNDKLLEPADFQAPIGGTESAAPKQHSRQAIISAGTGAWWHSQFNLMLIVFALLGATAVIFILLAPEVNSDASNVRVAVSGSSSKEKAVAPVVDEAAEISPFSQAQTEQARTDSQDILADLLDIQRALKNKQVEVWASQDYEAGLEMAELGDDLYSQKDYIGAIDKYRSALKLFEEIEQEVPLEVTRRVNLGYEAIDEGKSELANKHFQSALLLDKNSIPALQGLDRVQTLDQVLQYLAVAADFEKQFLARDDLSDLEEAQVNFQAAIDLDESTQSALLGLQRLKSLETDKLYRDAMSIAYSGLFSGRYSAARSGFNTALEHKPNDEIASAGLRQALASDKRVSLSALLTAASRFESQEQWASALSNYQTVLQRDRNQVSAKIGQIRTKARLDLDRKIKDVLSDTLILSKATEKERAKSILSEANAIKSKGPSLVAQIAELENALSDTEVTIKVAFNSDQATEVTLKKEGSKRLSLGRFDSKRMALKPGRYVLTGTRLGFRDVRKELVLTAGSKDTIQQFSIVCKQALVAAESGGV